MGFVYRKFYLARCRDCHMTVPFDNRNEREGWILSHENAHKDPQIITWEEQRSV